MDIPELSIHELDALFEQSPIAMVFNDNEMRARRANSAFRELMGFPGGDLADLPPTEQTAVTSIFDTQFVERTMAGQVIKDGVPAINVPLELNVEGRRKVAAWTAYRVTDNGRVFGVVSTLVDVTEQAQASADLRQANARLDLLQRAGSEIGTSLDVRRTAEELAALAVPELADRVTVDLLDRVLREQDPVPAAPGEVRFHRVGLCDAATTPTVTLTVGGLLILQATEPAAAAFLRGELIVARSPAELRQLGLPSGIVQPLLARGVHAWLGVPLTARGETLGVAAFSRAESPGPYGEAEVRLVRDLATRAALQIDNALLYSREHDAAVILQRSLMSRNIPRVPGLDIADHYQPASRATEIGGDWFDVIPLDGGKVALVVGDVTGHGIPAAAVMGQLRTTAATLARLGAPPEEIMRQLSSVVAAFGDEAGATCVLAVHDPWSRRCRLISAGHPPPALRAPDGSTEFIDLPAGLILGVGEDPYPGIDKQLAPGSVLALYTDGLIERPGEDLAIGMSRLADALGSSPAGSLDELRDDVLASLAPQPRDDVALLLARITATP